MIYIYNESDQLMWTLIDKNNDFLRLEVKDIHLGIDILKKNSDMGSYDTRAIENPKYGTNMENVFVLSWNAYGCYFNNKTGNPFLHTSDIASEYSLDLFLLTYKIADGLENICKNKSNKFTILYTVTDHESNLVHIIAIGKPINNPKLYITFCDKDQKFFNTKHLITDKSGVVRIINKNYELADVLNSKYKNSIMGKIIEGDIKPSKVSHPYGIIICPDNIREEYAVNKFHMSPNHTKYFEPDDPELYNKLKKLKFEKYNAATFYIDKDLKDITDDDMKIKYQTMFKHINFITKDGAIKS